MSDLMPSETNCPTSTCGAAVQCVCHDVIRRLRIANGLELIDDPEWTRKPRRPRWRCALLGENGSRQAEVLPHRFRGGGFGWRLIDMGEAGEIAKAFVGDEKSSSTGWAARERRSSRSSWCST